MSPEDKINYQIYEIEKELSDLFFRNKYEGSFDLSSNQRRNLSEEWIFLHRRLKELE
jgi:hypothetical protein